MTELIRILYVDDSPHDCALVRDALEREHGGFQVVEAASRDAFEVRLADGGYDLVLTDFNILGFEGLQVLDAVQTQDPHVPVIIVTRTGSEEVAAEAMKRGAADYVIKTPRHIRRLPLTIQTVIEKNRLRAEREQAEVERQVMFEITQGVVLTANLDELLRSIHASLEKVLDVRNCFVALYDQKSGMFRFLLFIDQFDTAPLPQAVGKSLTAYVFRTGRPLLVTEEQFGRLVERDEVELVGTPSPCWLGVPLKTPTETIGVLVVQSYENERAYTDRDLEFLVSVGGQIALAIQRKQAEEALHLNERKFSTIFHTSPDAIVISRLDDGLIFDCNDTFAQLAGYSRAEAVGKSALDLNFWVNPEQRQGLVERLRQDGEVHNWEAQFRMKDGAIRTMLLSARIIEIDGEPCILSIIKDISELKQAEAALVERETFLRMIFENEPECVKLLACDGTVLQMNPAGLAMVEADSPKQVLGQCIFPLVVPEHRSAFKNLTESVFQGQAGTLEFEIEGFKGARRWLKTHAVPLRNQPGDITAALGITRDITKEKGLEAQLLQAQKLESLGTLVGGIAHDFNNMLSGILGFSQLMMEEVAPTSPVYEGLQRIEVLSERAADMVKQLLAFSRREVAQKTDLWLHPFLREIGKLLERMIPEHIEIQLGLAPDHLMVEADPTQLQQVVMNLAVNARDAMPGGGRLSIETQPVRLDEGFCRAHPSLQPGAYVRVSVGDTGTGIAPEIRSRIFDPFFTTKGVGKGTGLGLAMVYGIVKNHNGAVEVESEVGRGTTFHLYLPVSAKPAVADAPPIQAQRGGETILLVEDEGLVLELGQKTLERFGYRVLTARDGVEAIEVYQAHREEIALVILDVMMPRMGGREAFQELKRLNPAVKALMATGYHSAEVTTEELLGEGISGVVMKPYRIHKLAQAVRAALEQGL
jgi:PAS domain S-box-containing protein